MDNVSALLREMINQLTTESANRRTRVRTATEALRAAADRVAAPDAARAELWQDVRAPLHTLHNEVTTAYPD